VTAPPRWSIRLTAAARTDFQAILRWTTREFGRQQARTYAETLSLAVTALTEGPRIAGARPIDHVAPGLFTLHVARAGRKGRHLVLFRVGSQDPPVIDVLRLLHDAMDLPRHLDEDPPPGRRGS